MGKRMVTYANATMDVTGREYVRIRMLTSVYERESKARLWRVGQWQGKRCW